MSGYTELASLLVRRNIGVACIQETKLSQASPYRDFPGYTSVRRDRPGSRGGGGLLILIHHSLQFTNLSTTDLFPGDDVTEHQGVSVAWGEATINIINIYIPPPPHAPSLSTLISPSS